MSFIDYTKIENIDGSVITKGNKNFIEVVNNIKRTNEANISSEGETWKEVVEKIKLLQKDVFQLPDEYEALRDQKIIPSLSEAKTEASKLIEKPTISKKGFLDSFSKFCEAIAKIAGIATTIGPIIVAICHLLGIQVPHIS